MKDDQKGAQGMNVRLTFSHYLINDPEEKPH